MAGRQCGRITWAQLRTLGVAPATIRRWVSTGYLIRVLPRVYAVGHSARDARSSLFSIVLFAGPGAALSHGTAAHWRGWLRYPVPTTHVRTPRRIRTELAGVRFHCAREVERELVHGVPCTPITRTLLDLAHTEPLKLVRHAIAQLDYERQLDSDQIRSACGPRRRGSAELLEALKTYIPQMARTKSDLEDEFLLLCRQFKIPLPEVNTYVHGVEVDCHWPAAKLVVELDGGGNHGTPAQRARDQRNALMLRSHGLTVVRYGPSQVARQAEAVARDLSSAMHGHARL